MFRAQNRKAEARKQRQIAQRQAMKERKKAIPAQLKEKWAKLQSYFFKTRYLKGKYTPHQGPQEKARRTQQMFSHRCINPETWK
jgi:hypothetical protein